MQVKKCLNQKQLETLRKLIGQHMHEILVNQKKAYKTFEKIKKYGVSTMPEAIALYKSSKKMLRVGA